MVQQARVDAPVATTRPATVSRGGLLRPRGSVDPLVDGMKSLVREMIQKGFPQDGADASPRASLRARGRRQPQTMRVARAGVLATASTLLAVQRDYRPKDGADPKRALTPEDDSRIRILAEGLGAISTVGFRPSAPRGRRRRTFRIGRKIHCSTA